MYDIFVDTKITGDYYQNVHIKPKHDTKIVCKNISYVYSKGNIAISHDGTDEYYYCFCSKNSHLVLGPGYGNTIIPLKITFGDKYRLSVQSFVAHTENIKMTKCSSSECYIADCQDKDFGYIWLSCCGNYNNISIKINEEITVNQNNFITCHHGTKYSILGHGFHFKGPCIVMIQTKGFDNLTNTNHKMSDMFQNIINYKNYNVRGKLRNI
jgi:uncharacterized protein (AIM24 family)